MFPFVYCCQSFHDVHTCMSLSLTVMLYTLYLSYSLSLLIFNDFNVIMIIIIEVVLLKINRSFLFLLLPCAILHA